MVTKRKHKRIEKVDRRSIDGQQPVQAEDFLQPAVPADRPKAAPADSSFFKKGTQPISDRDSEQAVFEPSQKVEIPPSISVEAPPPVSFPKEAKEDPLPSTGQSSPTVFTPVDVPPISARAKRVNEVPPRPRAAQSTVPSRGVNTKIFEANKVKAKKTPLTVMLIALGSFLGVCLLALSLVAWSRWVYYDDVADFQGEWYVYGSAAVIYIDDEYIQLTEDVSYSYSLDTAAKTIEFTFGSLEGEGHYRFSLDRCELIIIDGVGYTAFSTFFEDLGWLCGELWSMMSGNEAEEDLEGATVLSRTLLDGSSGN